MKRFIIAGLAAGLIAALSIGLTSQGSAAPKAPFMGAWESTDFDGSHQVMAIGGGHGRHHVTLHDDMATLACPETWGSATAIGFGTEVDPNVLHVEGLIRCPSEQTTFPWEADFTYDSSDDTLSGPLGLYSVQWNRIGH